MSESTIEEFYVEDRTFPPDSDFVKKALLNDSSHHEEAVLIMKHFGPDRRGS